MAAQSLSLDNGDGTYPTLQISHHPNAATTHGLPALAVGQADSTGPAFYARGAGDLLDLRNTVGTQQFKVDNSGNVTIAGTTTFTGQLYGVNPSGAEALTSGEVNCPRVVASITGASMTTQVLVLSYWTAVTSGTATTVTTNSWDTAASGLTLAKAGIYSVAANGDLALLAATADLHASLWGSTFTTYASSLSSNFTRVAGTRYALGCLAVGTTPPTLAGPSQSGTYASAPIMSGTVSGQSDLPSSVAHGSVTASFQFVSAIVSP